MTTLREQAIAAAQEMKYEVACIFHKRNYWKLHIWRDGRITLDESINQSDDLIDSQADHFCPVPSIITIGTGSVPCNCDWCQDEGYDSLDEAIADAVSEGGCDVGVDFDEAIGNIPVGYFDDEEEEENEDNRPAGM
jgi:hypothetical protein